MTHQVSIFLKCWMKALAEAHKNIATIIHHSLSNSPPSKLEEKEIA